MWFFLPSRLVQFEYFDTQPQNKEYEEIAKPYRNVMDFAFFVVNFGYSKADYLALTPTEKAFIMKAYEDKVVSNSTVLAMAVNNALNNALRKKGKQPIKLWKKKNHTVVDKEAMQLSIKQIIKHEEKVGKSWVEKIYKANGYKIPTAKGVK